LVTKKGSGLSTLEDLPAGSVVGTSSVRRVAQLRRAFPKLLFADVRGNINTRLSKLDAPDGPFTAIVLAAAGLNRLNLHDRISSYLECPVLYYAVGQGALGVEIRSNDAKIQNLVSQINDWQTAWTCRAEREMLRCLEGGCSVPVGCHTTLSEISDEASTTNGEVPSTSTTIKRSAKLKLSAIIASLSGERAIETTLERTVATVEEAEAVGADVAQELIAQGGKEILAELGRKVEDAAFKSRHEDAVRRAMERASKGETLSPQDAAVCGQDLELELNKSPRFRAKELPAVNGVNGYHS